METFNNHKTTPLLYEGGRTMLFKQKLTYITLAALFTVGGLLVMASITLAQDSPWVRKKDMPTGRHSFTTSVVDDKIYAFGGRYTDNLVTEYDPTNDTWTTKTPMPTPRMISASGVVNGKIYVIGGLVIAFDPAISTVQEYNPATDAWKTKKSMPTKRLGLGVSVVDGKIYAIGGMTSGTEFWSGMHKTVEVYDPLTDTWSTKSDMPTARVWFSTSVVDGKIYAIGGAPVTKNPLSIVEVYDPATDTWTTKTPMPTKRVAHAAAVVNGIIYVFGGGTVSAEPGDYSGVEAYDPTTDTWARKADMPQPRAFLSASVVGGKIYAIGGIPTFDDPHLHGLKTVYEYNPSKDLTALINQVNINKCFAVAGSDSVCISTKLNNPTGVTLLAEMESPDNTQVDSLELFDDGNHNDGNAGDSLYANIWPVSSAEECQYYMDLKVTQVGAETIIHRMNNMVLFTTIGPIIIENYTLSTADTMPNPGDNLYIKLTLKNEGSTTTAINVKAKLISLDTLATVTSGANRPLSFSDIESGELKTSTFYRIKISENCPDNAEIQFAVEITSNDYHFWSDTFSIPVVPQATMINMRENIPQQLSLYQNYPNPFNPSTIIEFSIPKSEFVILKVYNILGEEVATLVNKKQPVGSYQVQWDATGYAGGIYFYRLTTDKGFSETKKLLYLK
jgi:N-acetylneuraminic acid mutarotase